ncbi:RNase A-like domain-containing protein [Streptomyces sp. enrichment culture]|uniref:RNase A-like domain-containing protein n=1 Tax=Streptomyces sp. enrichment culture TaxID=1795815 RepID=UPI003F576AB6
MTTVIFSPFRLRALVRRRSRKNTVAAAAIGMAQVWSAIRVWSATPTPTGSHERVTTRGAGHYRRHHTAKGPVLRRPEGERDETRLACRDQCARLRTCLRKPQKKRGRATKWNDQETAVKSVQAAFESWMKNKRNVKRLEKWRSNQSPNKSFDPRYDLLEIKWELRDQGPLACVDQRWPPQGVATGNKVVIQLKYAPTHKPSRYVIYPAFPGVRRVTLMTRSYAQQGSAGQQECILDIGLSWLAMKSRYPLWLSAEDHDRFVPRSGPVDAQLRLVEDASSQASRTIVMQIGEDVRRLLVSNLPDNVLRTVWLGATQRYFDPGQHGLTGREWLRRIETAWSTGIWRSDATFIPPAAAASYRQEDSRHGPGTDRGRRRRAGTSSRRRIGTRPGPGTGAGGRRSLCGRRLPNVPQVHEGVLRGDRRRALRCLHHLGRAFRIPGGRAYPKLRHHGTLRFIREDYFRPNCNDEGPRRVAGSLGCF